MMFDLPVVPFDDCLTFVVPASANPNSDESWMCQEFSLGKNAGFCPIPMCNRSQLPVAMENCNLHIYIYNLIMYIRYIYIYIIYIRYMFSYQNLHFQYFQLCQRLTGRACHDATLGGAEQLVFYQSSDGQLIFLAPWHHQKRWVSLLSAGLGGYIVYIHICPSFIFTYLYVYLHTHIYMY